MYNSTTRQKKAGIWLHMYTFQFPVYISMEVLPDASPNISPNIRRLSCDDNTCSPMSRVASGNIRRTSPMHRRGLLCIVSHRRTYIVIIRRTFAEPSANHPLPVADAKSTQFAVGPLQNICQNIVWHRETSREIIDLSPSPTWVAQWDRGIRVHLGERWLTIDCILGQ